jgi:glycosyltransferase involved in cell wall biosynthesis
LADTNLLIINQFASTPKYSSGAGERFYYLAPFFQKEGIKTRVVSGGYNHLFVANPRTPKLFNDEEIVGGLFTWVKLRQYKKSSFLGRFLSWIEFFLKLFFLKHKDRPDIVLVSSMSLFPIVYAFWLRMRFGAKVILEVRDIWPLTPMELGGYGPRNPFILLLSVLEKWAYRSADELVSVLPDFSKHVRNVLGREKYAHWIPNAIPASMVPEERGRIGEDANDKFVLIYTGAIGIANAMDVAIEAAKLLQGHKDFLFRIVGEGPDKQNLVEKAQAYQLKNVEFIGKVPKDEVVIYLNDADAAFISWQDSGLYEFGVSANKYNDYMLASLPIISASNMASDPVRRAKCGIQVDAGDAKAIKHAVLSLKDMSVEDRRAIGKRGYDYVIENQVYSAIAKTYAKLLKS